MAWLPFLPKSRQSFIVEEFDDQACYDSFKEHWQQASKILSRTQQQPSHDDVLGVVNHLEQMISLLKCVFKKDKSYLNTLDSSSSQCMEYLLSEGILDKLFQWSMSSGKYINAVRCEQFKLYELLISQSRHILLAHDSFVKPLLKLLSSCHGELFSKELEQYVVDLLNQLSALLMQNVEFIELFFDEHKRSPRFIIFSLLLPFVHREDSIGMRARDALLLCMSLSKKNKAISIYIAKHSNFSLLAATGLSGLYSALPNVIDDIIVPDWHRFTPDDVNEIKGLLTFVTSLEFSNAVAQVAHPMIRKQLQELFYRGFLKNVLEPALLQASIHEQVAATAYFELILRTVSEPGLMHSMLKFLLESEGDEQKLLYVLMQRIKADGQLCLVSLAVFKWLVEMNCEDLMLEMVFKHLQPCLHIMLSQRPMWLPLDQFCQSFEKILALAPNCCDLPENHTLIDGHQVQWNYFKYKQSLYGKYYAYLSDARNKIGRCQMDCTLWSNSYSGCIDVQSSNCEDNSQNSLSCETSSGYESFVTNFDDSKSYWETSSIRNDRNKVRKLIVNEEEQFNASASAGPFLTILLEKLRNFLSNSIYINLHLTGLISRLAVYPQPLLRAYLLDYSLVLQPNVPSIFEIIGILKQNIDEYMKRQATSSNLIEYAKDCLIEREIMLLNARGYHPADVPIPVTTKLTTPVHEPFQRNGSKRRSLTSLAATMFSRRPSQAIESPIPLLPTAEDVQFNLTYPKYTEEQHVALCAVLLDEWVKELAALAQEHTIAQLATLLK